MASDGSRVGSGSTRHDVPGETKLRVLVDPDTLTVVDPSGRLVGGSPRSDRTRQRGLGGEPAEPRVTEPSRPRNRKPLRGYSDQEREDVGFDLARRVLSSDHNDIVDLRAQHGVGADAMDELERFYELKVSAGSETNEVTLTSAEWQRAKSSPNFFLVIVSNVEEGADSGPSIRIIPQPLRVRTIFDGGLIPVFGGFRLLS